VTVALSWYIFEENTSVYTCMYFEGNKQLQTNRQTLSLLTPLPVSFELHLVTSEL